MNLKVLLGVSMVLNLALAGGYFLRSPVPQSSPPSSAAPGIAISTAGGTRMDRKTRTISSNVVQTIDWRHVESEDYKKYIANLRSIGCPEETLRDIITADVNKLFESRRKALQKPKEPFKFWKGGNPFAGLAFDEESVKQQQELAREKRALLKELLGIELEEKPNLMAAFNPFESMLDFLPSEKQNKVMETLQTYQAKIMKSMDGGADGMKNMRKVQKELDAELGKIMSPQEKEDYDLRLSETAMMMRMQMGSFDSSEQEFRDLFKLRKQFDDEHGPFNSATEKVDRDKYVAAQKELDEQIKQTLGEERHKEYKLAQSPTYQGLVKFAEREGMPREVAGKVYEMKKAAETQIKTLNANTALSDEQRQSARQAIQSETERAVGETMGAKFESYRNSSGNWIKRLGSTSTSRPTGDE